MASMDVTNCEFCRAISLRLNSLILSNLEIAKLKDVAAQAASADDRQVPHNDYVNCLINSQLKLATVH
jgi:hypothetical protein